MSKQKASKAKPTFKDKALQLLQGKRNPILAVIVLLAVASVGYYGYVYSSAESNYNQLRQDCRDRYPNNKTLRDNCLENVDFRALNDDQAVIDYDAFKTRCRERNADNAAARNACVDKVNARMQSDKQAAERLNLSCKDLKRNDGSGSKCGTCLNGYVDIVGDPNDGKCEKIPDCSQNENYIESANACYCKAGYTRGDGGNCTKAGTPEEVKIDCRNHYNRNSSGLNCTTCQSGYVDVDGDPANGKCSAKVSCSASNEVYTSSTNSCECTAGYLKQAGVCTKASDLKKACDDQFRTLNNNGKCGTCLPGYFLNGTVCSQAVTGDAQTVQTYCQNNLHQTYNVATNSCNAMSCIGGYYWSAADSRCLSTANTQPSIVMAACAAQQQAYNQSTNSCGQCLQSLVLQDGLCKALTAADIQKLRDNCKALNLEFDTKTNACSATCLGGYVKDKTACVSTKDLSADQVKKLCNTNHLQYDEKANTCKSDCVKGFVKTPLGLCLPVDIIKESCDKLKLQFDKKDNDCSQNCRGGYLINANQICVDQAEQPTAMSERVCRALGRKWSAPPTKQPVCTETCTDEKATFVKGKDDLSSYCQNKDLTGLGVSSLSPDECRKANRIYLTEVSACSAYCVTGYHLDKDTCVVTVILTEVTPPIKPEDPKPCSVPLETRSSTDSNGQTVIIKNVCPDDDPVVPENPVSAGNDTLGAALPDDVFASGELPEDSVDTLIDEETCDLLGRSWVGSVTIDGEELSGGCSTDSCQEDGATARAANDSVYCDGSVERIDEEECDDSNREWLDEVGGCASEDMEFYDESDMGDYADSEGEYYDETGFDEEAASASDKEDVLAKTTKSVIGSSVCVAPYTTYEHHDANNGGDRCRLPTVLERVRGVFQRVGTTVSDITSIPPRALCTLQPKKAWQEGAGCTTRTLPIIKIGEDAVQTDSFGKSFDANSSKVKVASCDDVTNVVSDQDADKFNCTTKSECQSKGGFITKVYAINKDSGNVFTSRVCWRSA